MATGATLCAAVQALNEEHPKRLIAAVPVGPPETYENIGAEVDEIRCALMPTVFHGASQ
jgi:predicted phosphoribosyltransferase